MATFRPLQPAPMDDEPPSHPHTRPLLTQKPKRTVTLGACVACRKRKSKCDGIRPVCTCCSQKDTECIYELGPNEKPSQAMKRKNEEMQGELSNLRQLYDFLRLRPEHEALDIFKRIRSNPVDKPPTQRIQELADFVRHGDVGPEQPSLPAATAYQNDPTRPVTLPPLRLALDAPSNIDPNLYDLPGIKSMGVSVPISQRPRYVSDDYVTACSDSQRTLPPRTSIEALLHPAPGIDYSGGGLDPRLAAVVHWTNVTRDTKLLVSILSEWTSREYSYYHYLDKDAFLQDMTDKRTTFCSALLVNALLATACSTCPAVLDRSKPFSENSIMTAFYWEAVRLWKEDCGEDTLPRLEAAICLYVFLGKQGRDKEGTYYLREACQIAHNLGFYQNQSPSPPPTPRGVSSEKWTHVCAVTAWALFNFQLTMAFTYKSPPVIRSLPRQPIPYHKGTASGSRALFQSECSRNIILLDCVPLVQRSDGSARSKEDMPDPRDVDERYYQLLSWWESRPPSIHPDVAPLEENLLVAMIYYTNIIDLFRPFIEQGPPIGQPNAYAEHAQCVTRAALKEIRRLLTLQELRHGWSSCIGLVLHPLSVASFGSLNEISQLYSNPLQAEGTEQYQGLLVCLRALSATCGYIYYAQPLFRLITQRCKAMELRLPPELQRGIEAYNTDEWTRMAASLVSSEYIADAQDARMDAIVSAWEDLSLNEQRKGKERGM